MMRKIIFKTVFLAAFLLSAFGVLARSINTIKLDSKLTISSLKSEVRDGGSDSGFILF